MLLGIGGEGGWCVVCRKTKDIFPVLIQKKFKSVMLLRSAIMLDPCTIYLYFVFQICMIFLS